MANQVTSDPAFHFGDLHNIPLNERIGMSEGHRLKPDQPSPRLLWSWCKEGRLAGGVRLKLPSFIGAGGRRYTTDRAFRWWVETLNELDQA